MNLDFGQSQMKGKRIISCLIRRLEMWRNRLLLEDFVEAHRNVKVSSSVRFDEMPLILGMTDCATLEIGPCTFVRSHVALKLQGNLRIGANCYVGPFTFLNVISTIEIGSGVQIGEMVSIVDHDHLFQNPTVAIYEQGLRTAPIIIEDNVWIGAGSRILRGVVIGQGAIIGAGAVVADSIPPMSIATGIPARVKSERI